jgi:hypothetical protein
MIKMKCGDIYFNLHREKRETMNISVDPSGAINVLAPQEITINELNQFIDNKKHIIYKSMSKLKTESNFKREIKNGQGFLYLGKSYKLKIKKNLKQPLSLRQGRFHLDRDYQDQAREYFIKFYKDKSQQHIQQRIDYFQAQIGVSPDPIRIMELDNHWGSTSDKHLNFNWRLIMAPMDIIDYVIVHELAHLIEIKHNKHFWEIVESVMHDYQSRKNWLRTNGLYLDF